MDNSYGFMVFEKPIEEYFDYAVTHGLKHLELDMLKKHSHLKTFTPIRIQKIKESAQRHGIQLSLHPAYNINLGARFSFIRNRHISYLRQCIILASQLGMKHITSHIGHFHRTAIWAAPRSGTLERAVRSIGIILKTCEEYDVQLALENVMPLPPEAGFLFLGDNIDDFRYIFSSLDSPCLKMCLDIGHANTNEGPLEYVKQLGDKFVNVHFHDNMGTHDDHIDVGTGTVPWKELCAALNGINYDGPYVSECFKSTPHEASARLETYF
ncbi:MAG: sugar phosphate isomerase/epimerase [bacterium]|nr:sugar phosphate isomerase/epimerase [bacterium]